MATVANLITDDTIRAAALARGYGDATVTRHVERTPYYGVDERPAAAQVWYLLSVKRSADADWETLGRRRTRGELLQLLKSMANNGLAL